jgi:hypothetical protein
MPGRPALAHPCRSTAICPHIAYLLFATQTETVGVHFFIFLSQRATERLRPYSLRNKTTQALTLTKNMAYQRRWLAIPTVSACMPSANNRLAIWRLLLQSPRAPLALCNILMPGLSRSLGPSHACTISGPSTLARHLLACNAMTVQVRSLKGVQHRLPLLSFCEKETACLCLPPG